MKFELALALLTSITLAPAAANPSGIVVSDVWSRPAVGTAVVYATLVNGGRTSDRLIGASSPVATAVELHDSAQPRMPGMSMSMGTMPTGNAMMTMKSLTSIPIAAGATTQLAPGGYHLMLDLRRNLKPGESIPLRLHFAHAGWIATITHVRPIR